MTGQLKDGLRPDYVIPFKLDKDAAKEALMKHYNGKKLLPKVFKDQNHIDEVKGVYVPFWLFDADVDADVRYKATKTSFWSDSEYDYSETSARKSRPLLHSQKPRSCESLRLVFIWVFVVLL